MDPLKNRQNNSKAASEDGDSMHYVYAIERLKTSVSYISTQGFGISDDSTHWEMQNVYWWQGITVNDDETKASSSNANEDLIALAKNCASNFVFPSKSIHFFSENTFFFEPVPFMIAEHKAQDVSNEIIAVRGLNPEEQQLFIDSIQDYVSQFAKAQD